MHDECDSFFYVGNTVFRACGKNFKKKKKVLDILSKRYYHNNRIDIIETRISKSNIKTRFLQQRRRTKNVK